MSLWKALRIFLLLLILLSVALNEYLVKYRSMDWSQPMLLVIYPLNGDGDARTQQYIEQLDRHSFQPIQGFIQRETRRYNLPKDRDITIDVSHGVSRQPPAPPRGTEVSVLDTMWWSLTFRWFAWREDNYHLVPDAQLFVTYYYPDNVTKVPHSLGLQKGMVGAVHAFAHRKMRGQNQVVIAHEWLHTLGASDKYDMATNEPLYPVGYAEPDKQPLLPQRWTEIMAGRYVQAPGKVLMPRSLEETVIGLPTAVEIGLVK